MGGVSRQYQYRRGQNNCANELFQINANRLIFCFISEKNTSLVFPRTRYRVRNGEGKKLPAFLMEKESNGEVGE